LQRPTSDTPELRAQRDRLQRTAEQAKASDRHAAAKIVQMRRRLDPDGSAERAQLQAELNRRREIERLEAAKATRRATVKGPRPSPTAAPTQQDVQQLIQQNAQVLAALNAVLGHGRDLFEHLTGGEHETAANEAGHREAEGRSVISARVRPHIAR